MIGKLSVLGFALVTAVTGQALAHDSHDSRGSRHHRPSDQGYDGAGRRGYDARAAEVDLRYADLNRDGWVTMQEALDSGRQVFRRQDRDNNRVLTPREVGREVRHNDRNNDGRVSMREYQRRVRAHFASLDVNRDGYLGRRELGYGRDARDGRPRGTRSAGWYR